MVHCSFSTIAAAFFVEYYALVLWTLELIAFQLEFVALLTAKQRT